MASKERVKDKHLKLDQEVLDQARRILGAKTELWLAMCTGQRVGGPDTKADDIDTRAVTSAP